MAKTKVALIGASGYATHTDTHRVDSFGWHQLGKLSNLRDYDAVVISLLERVPAENAVHVWNKFTEQLTTAVCREITSHNGKVIVIGDPRFTILTTDETDSGKRIARERRFLEFTSARFTWDEQGGDSLIVPDGSLPDGVAAYLKHLKRWNYALKMALWGASAGNVPKMPFATNRYGLMLAGALFDNRNLYLLPEISLSPDATLRLILQKMIGVDLAEDVEPPWAGEFVVCGQPEIDRALAERDAEIERLKQEFNQLSDKRAAMRQHVRLLYQRGTPLEPIVRHTMATLGAAVREPTEAGEEDGWIEYNGRIGVLEVKSTNGQTFGEDGIAQLAKWMINSGDQNAKGIFVGLAAAGQRPSDVSPFNPHYAKSAAKYGIVAMLSRDLYLAHELMQQGKLTPAEFWPTVFDTNGIYSADWLKAKSAG